MGTGAGAGAGVGASAEAVACTLCLEPLAVPAFVAPSPAEGTRAEVVHEGDATRRACGHAVHTACAAVAYSKTPCPSRCDSKTWDRAPPPPAHVLPAAPFTCAMCRNDDVGESVELLCGHRSHPGCRVVRPAYPASTPAACPSDKCPACTVTIMGSTFEVDLSPEATPRPWLAFAQGIGRSVAIPVTLLVIVVAVGLILLPVATVTVVPVALICLHGWIVAYNVAVLRARLRVRNDRNNNTRAKLPRPTSAASAPLLA